MRFGIVLVSFWDRFGIVLGPFWDSFGIVLVQFWNRFGIVLGTGGGRVVAGRCQNPLFLARAPTRGHPYFGSLLGPQGYAGISVLVT